MKLYALLAVAVALPIPDFMSCTKDRNGRRGRCVMIPSPGSFSPTWDDTDTQIEVPPGHSQEAPKKPKGPKKPKSSQKTFQKPKSSQKPSTKASK
jgi:hypothetical protein